MKKFNIESEDSSDHWQDLNVSNKNVLDLGCGRWCNRYGGENTNFEEFSPIYFKQRGAKKIIAVDASIDEIKFFSEKTNQDPDFLFIHKTISSANEIRDLIKKFQIEVIKCDIEGAETNLYEFTKNDMSEIIEIAIEYHDLDIKNKIKNKLVEWGFEIHSEGFLWGENVGVYFAKK